MTYPRIHAIHQEEDGEQEQRMKGMKKVINTNPSNQNVYSKIYTIPVTNEFRDAIHEFMRDLNSTAFNPPWVEVFIHRTGAEMVVNFPYKETKKYTARFLIPDLCEEVIRFTTIPGKITDLVSDGAGGKEYMKIIYHSMNNKYTLF